MPGGVPCRRTLLVSAGLVAVTAVAIAAVERARRRRKQLLERRRVALRASSRYAAGVLAEAAASQGFKIDPKAACQWGDFARLDWDRLLRGEKDCFRTSCLYLRAGLVRKGMLAYHLKKRKVEGVLPLGFTVDIEDEEDLEGLRKLVVKADASSAKSPQSASTHPTWVAKASNANRGEHLHLAHSPDEVVDLVRKAALEGDDKIVEWVVQRYIHPPVLLHGRKFHLRAHVLVSGCPHSGITRAWLHERSIVALAASVRYDSDVVEEARSKHLTNHCLQESHPAFDESKQILLLEEVVAALSRPDLTQHIISSITSSMASALGAAASAPTGFAPLPQCFELFGADFTLQDRGSELPDVFLLEVNAGPDLGIFGERLRNCCVAMAEDILRVAIEPQVSNEAIMSAPFSTKPESSTCSSATSGTGFGPCLWSSQPRTASLGEELSSFKRRLTIAGQWAKALHEDNGVEVRGPQAQLAQ